MNGTDRARAQFRVREKLSDIYRDDTVRGCQAGYYLGPLPSAPRQTPCQ